MIEKDADTHAGLFYTHKIERGHAEPCGNSPFGKVHVEHHKGG